MTTTLKSMLSAQLGWTWRDVAGTLVVTDSNRLAFDIDLADGAGRVESDAIWHATDQSLASGQAMTLELDALGQTIFGDTITIPLAKVKAILIVNKNDGDDGYLSVGGAEANAWSAPFGTPGDTVHVMPGSPLLLANVGNGWNVEAGSFALRLGAAGGPVTFDIAILGILADGEGSSSNSSGSGNLP
jgi:hypothetical protein